MVRFLVISLLIIGPAFSHAQKQGICGKVVWEEGNRMPGPDKKKADPKPIIREVYIYQPVRQDQTTMANGLYTDIRVALVKTVKTEADGSFKISLPPGEYSLFTKEEGGFFANLFDSGGRINVVEVKPRKYSETTIRVNYRAFY